MISVICQITQFIYTFEKFITSLDVLLKLIVVKLEQVALNTEPKSESLTPCKDIFVNFFHKRRALTSSVITLGRQIQGFGVILVGLMITVKDYEVMKQQRRCFTIVGFFGKNRDKQFIGY